MLRQIAAALAISALLIPAPAYAVGAGEEAQEKIGVPTVIQEVSHDRKSWYEETDVSSYDCVVYRDTGTLPGKIGEAGCSYAFIDRPESIISVDTGSVKVTLRRDGADEDVTGSFSVSCESASRLSAADATTPAETGSSSLEVKCDDISALFDEYDPSALLILEYRASIARPSTGFADPNENSTRVRYSFPNAGTGDTPSDLTFLYSYKLKIDKEDAKDGTPLEGAAFAVGDGTRWLSPSGWLVVPFAYRTGSDGSAYAGCVSVGTISVSETEAPDGYRLAGDVTIEISRNETARGKALDVKADGAELVSADPASGQVEILIRDERKDANGYDPSGDKVVPPHEGGDGGGEEHGEDDPTAGDDGKDNGDGGGSSINIVELISSAPAGIASAVSDTVSMAMTGDPAALSCVALAIGVTGGAVFWRRKVRK